MDTLSTIDTALLIGAAFEAGQEAKEPILNPRTGGLILEVPEASTAQIDRAVGRLRPQGLCPLVAHHPRRTLRRPCAHRRPGRGRGRRLCSA